jgi:hypothetical protein
MKTTPLKTLRWIAVLALLAVAAAWQSRRLTGYRRSQLPEAYTGVHSDVPPVLTFVMAGLGGFRGIAAEVLWFRASRLQEEGRYIELVQLADWLTLLDPHASEAWVYNAWNLSYNVSIMMARPEDRLRWVENGIALLRDEGLRFNPREARLYRELAWLYMNKVGDSLDEAHLTYKVSLADALAPDLNADGTVRPDLDAAGRERLAARRLDPARMAALEKRFGPLDWRLANSHALYWAVQGLDHATGSERPMCNRAVYQPLLLSVFDGRFTGDLAARKWQTAPNPALALSAAEFLAATQEEFPSKNTRNMYRNFLLTAIKTFNRPGRENADIVDTLFRRLVQELGESAQNVTIDAITKGWTPNEK